MLDEKSGQAYKKVKYERRSEWGESMKYGQISREQLLQAAKVLVAQEGAQALNIRRLAASCGVSVGSIYNYFPAKSDLVAALIGDFWREAVHGVPWPLQQNLKTALRYCMSGCMTIFKPLSRSGFPN